MYTNNFIKNIAGQKYHLRAPAKVNLCLYLTEKRADGYHNLATVMQKLDLYDFLELELDDSGKVTITCDTTDIPADESNLALRAARLFLEKSRRLAGCGIRINLQKNIPIAAGLGGGSSDAGAVLRQLNSCAEGEFTLPELLAMARQLGADVPFFVVEGGAVFAEGIGDIMYPYDSFDNFDFLLVNPALFVSTAQIFQNLVLTSELKSYTIARLRRGNITLEDMYNELEEVTFSFYPQLRELKQTLQETGAEKVLMSGSGATMFGIFAKSGTKDEKRKTVLQDMLHNKYGELVFWLNAC